MGTPRTDPLRYFEPGAQMPFECVRLEHRGPIYLRISPVGWVTAIVERLEGICRRRWGPIQKDRLGL